MNEFRKIQAIDLDFFPKDLYLINKYADRFNTLTKIYSDMPMENLVEEFFALGNKRFKTKSSKLKYLAMYQAILNHDDLMPTKDRLQNQIEYELSRLGYFSFDSENDDENSSEEGEEQEEEFDKSEEVHIVMKTNYDLRHKWARILTRIEEVNEYVNNVVDNTVQKYDEKRFMNQPSNEEQEYIPAEPSKDNRDYMFR